jgi:uroporphyrinogen-III decarboxylase
MKWYAGENLPGTHARPTFSEAWFYTNHGMTFGEKYCSDPIFRTEQDREARRLLFERFGKAGIGEKDPQPRPHLEICGHRFLPALFGCEIVFQDDQAPSYHHLPTASAAEFACIPRPDLETNRWAQQFRRQGAILLDKYGFTDAAINYGGPLNGAVAILGNEGLLYLSESPEIMTRFLSLIADVCVEAHDTLTVAFDPKAANGRQLFIGNCPVMMISPATYAKVVLPADLYYRQQIENFGLHHCGQMDRYLEAYQNLKPVDFIEVGWGSDVAAVHKAFPDSKLELMINIYDLQTMSQTDVRELMVRMVREVGSLSCLHDVWVADIGPEVPDEVILDFVEAVNWAVAQL